jgi:cell division protein FtsB
MKAIRILQVLVGIVAAGLVALILVSDLAGPGRRVLDSLDNERSALELRSQDKTRQNDRLREEVRALKQNRKVLEHRIREDLGYVKDDELVIVVPK